MGGFLIQDLREASIMGERCWVCQKSHRHHLSLVSDHCRLEVTFLQLWDAATFLLLLQINFKCNIVLLAYVNQSAVWIKGIWKWIAHFYWLWSTENLVLCWNYYIILSYKKHCSDTKQVSAQILVIFHQKWDSKKIQIWYSAEHLSKKSYHVWPKPLSIWYRFDFPSDHFQKVG